MLEKILKAAVFCKLGHLYSLSPAAGQGEWFWQEWENKGDSVTVGQADSAAPFLENVALECRERKLFFCTVLYNWLLWTV